MRRRKTPARALPMLMLALGFARPPLPDKVKGTQGFPNQPWTAEYQAGTIAAQKGLRLKLAIVDQGIFSNVNSARFSISLARLAAVYFDERARRTSIAVSQMPRSGCHYAELRYQDQMRLQLGTPATAKLMAVPARPTIIGKIADRLLFERSIALFWNVGTRQEAVVVNINECEYGPFLSILQDATGARWPEVKREWSTIRPARNPAQGLPLSVQVDRRAKVGAGYLDPGLYQISLLDTSASQKTLIFFDPKGHVKALARARVTSETGSPSGVHLDYVSRSGTNSLTRLATPRIVLTLESGPP